MPVLKAGVINHNGYMYDQDCLNDIHKQIQLKIKNNGGMFGEIIHEDRSSHNFDVILTNVSHTTIDSKIAGDKLVAKIQVLKTPKGKELFNAIKNDLVVFRPRGIGDLSVTNKVQNYQITSINAVSKETDAFKGLI